LELAKDIDSYIPSESLASPHIRISLVHHHVFGLCVFSRCPRSRQEHSLMLMHAA